MLIHYSAQTLTLRGGRVAECVSPFGVNLNSNCRSSPEMLTMKARRSPLPLSQRNIRQSKPRSSESNSILIPLPSRTCAAYAAQSSFAKATEDEYANVKICKYEIVEMTNALRKLE